MGAGSLTSDHKPHKTYVGARPGDTHLKYEIF
jgi:hypothetical protein